MEATDEISLDKNKKHNIEVVVDRIVMKEGISSRLADSLESALQLGEGRVLVDIIGEKDELLFSEHYSCPICGFSIDELEPRLFSFNTPFGACPSCDGLGTKLEVDEDLVIPDKNLSLRENAIAPWEPTSSMYYPTLLATVCKHYEIDMDIPVKDIPKKKMDIVLHGSGDEEIYFRFEGDNGRVYEKNVPFEGVIPNLERRYRETSSEYIREMIQKYMTEKNCPTCKGNRLKKEALAVFVGGKNISEVTKLSIRDSFNFFDGLTLTQKQEQIARLILREIKERLSFLVNVGLDYLMLSRAAGTLSGGEAQRIRLATQIGSRLTGVLYILDEPSIGLHQRDNDRLIDTLKSMRDLGNTLIVVEHDEDTMLAADYLVDIGPGAGAHGGEVSSAGTPEEVMNDPHSLTGKYLKGEKFIPVPTERRKGNGKKLEIIGAKENNLKNVKASFPLGAFTAVTGVSGSGKSTLINEILFKALAHSLNKAKSKPGQHKEIKGMEHLDKVIDVNQAPIGRTPRSNPATYTGVFDDIRDVYASTNEAKVRGYQKGRFSFNVKGGRCEACRGDGIIKIEMHFLPDVYVPCEVCHGKRYNRETLEVKYKDKSISDVLDMTVEDAVVFFEHHPKISRKLQTIVDVGLGYVKLGQPATTLSGGEAQRVKLASELHKRSTGRTLYILDEPTTGLHADDIARLLKVLQRLVENGDTVLVIEHNLDVIKVADYIVDLGPEGGDNGGTIVATGTPEQVMKVEASHTARYLKAIIDRDKARMEQKLATIQG